MMKCAVVLIPLLAFATAQHSNPSAAAVLIPQVSYARCSICTARASYFSGNSFVHCNQESFSSYFSCVGCCDAYGASQGIGPAHRAGFLSQNGRCVCCVRC